MAINYNFVKGSDFPVWQWLPFYASGATTYHGFDNDYDGVRYIYCAAQTGSTATTASTTQLWRFDTWGHGWQYLATLTSGNRGVSLTYDGVRNVLIITHGAALTSWQIFNLNPTSISICGVACASWTATTMTPVLPAAADYGATVVTIKTTAIPSIVENGTVTSGTTTTTLIDTATTSAFCDQMVGLQVKLTSGAYINQKRFITSVTDANTLVLGSAFGGTPAVGDGYIISLPDGTASSATTSTLVDSAATWTVNQYTNSDVVIVSGTGAGQKRRIGSNTANTLTLAAAQTGNANTGNWSVTPDATSVYKIQPSSDFLYYAPGTTGTGFYKIDLATGSTAPTWSTLTASPAALGGGGNIMWPDAIGAFNMLVMRGSGTATFYNYNIGLNSWTTPAMRCGVETFNTGASSTIWDGQRKIIIHKESTTRLYALNIATRELEPLATMPYAGPSAYCGKRARVVTNSDGSQWLYMQRAGGGEFFRVPLEWGTL
jgi:hypothetical protein